MSKTSTNHDIIRHIYNELEERKQEQLTIETLIDPKSKDLLEIFSSVKDEMDKIMLSPSDSVIEKIKDYSLSKKRSVEPV